MLQWIKEKSAKRRALLAQHCGLESEAQLGAAFGRPKRNRRQKSDLEHCDKKLALERPKPFLQNGLAKDQTATTSSQAFKGSSTFLKGTQSANPHNDYCQHFVDTGQRPQNFIRDVGLADRFEEYPKLKELIRLKDELIAKTAVPPMYLKAELQKDFNLSSLRGKFDVILIEPPLEEYQSETVTVSNTPARSFWTWDEIMALPIEDISAQRGFVFLWVGSSDGLDLGRQCLRKWGFRRCEDICWIKTNVKNRRLSKCNAHDPRAIFQRTKEHCLMGIKGTVRRSTDGDFIHANVDIDLIISEQPDFGDIEKPEEMFHIIEHFCLGRRRLHLFGRDTTIRPGWLTIGPNLTNSNFNADTYWAFFEGPNGHLTGCSDRIEALRPKSPPPKSNKGSISGGGPPGPNQGGLLVTPGLGRSGGARTLTAGRRMTNI